MVLLTSSAEYIHQSSLLISARPTTTRITTHYGLPKLGVSKGKSRKLASNAATATATATPATPAAATLTLKTYDPVSGVVLKYTTNRAAEVGRLMAALGRLGGVMASGRMLASAVEGGDAVQQGGGEGDSEGVQNVQNVQNVKGKDGPAVDGVQSTQQQGQGQAQQQASTKGKGKKKGKR